MPRSTGWKSTSSHTLFSSEYRSDNSQREQVGAWEWLDGASRLGSPHNGSLNGSKALFVILGDVGFRINHTCYESSEV